jgi:hypothetical protein
MYGCAVRMSVMSNQWPVARTPALACEVVLRSSLLWRRVQTASDVRSQCAKIVAIAAATTATQRWTGGACGRRFGSVRGRGRHGVVVVPSQCAEIVAIATATTATQRWTGGTCGRRFGSVRGRDRHGVIVVVQRGGWC